jgi:O-antigen ligase
MAVLTLFKIIANASFNRVRLLSILVISACVQALWGLTQFLTQSSFAFKWLGLASHPSDALGTSVIEVSGVNSERWLRAYGSLPHPNLLGAFLAVAIIISLAMIARQPSFKRNENELNYKKFWHLSLIFLSAGLFVSFSRSAILAVFAGIIVILIYYRHALTRLALPLGLILITVLTLVSQFGYIYNSRWKNTDRLETKSITERLDYMDQAQKLITYHPFTGNGIYNFGLAVFNNKLSTSDSAFYYQPVHNVFLLIASETGIIVTVSFIIIVLMILAKISRHSADPTYTPLGIALIGSVIMIMFLDHYFWTQVSGAYLLWLILGLAVNFSQTDSILKNKERTN